MKNNDDKRSGLGLALIAIPAMVLCCAFPSLLAGGTISGLIAWLVDGSLVAITLVVIAGTAAVFLFRYWTSRMQKDEVPRKSTIED